MDDLNPRAVMGDNRPPPFDPERHTDLGQRVDAFMAVCNDVRAAGPLDSDEKAERLADHIAGMRGLKNQVEDTRKAEKKPHDEAAKAVQEAFSPMVDRLDRAIKAMLGMQGDWIALKQAAADEARRQREAEAARLAKEAEDAAKAALESGSIDGEMEAERLAKAAADAGKAAARETKVSVGSATGAGRTISTRTIRKAEIINVNLLLVRYRAHPKMLELLHQLADADIRSKDITEANAAVFGVKIVESKVAA